VFRNRTQTNACSYFKVLPQNCHQEHAIGAGYQNWDCRSWRIRPNSRVATLRDVDLRPCVPSQPETNYSKRRALRGFFGPALCSVRLVNYVYFKVHRLRGLSRLVRDSDPDLFMLLEHPHLLISFSSVFSVSMMPSSGGGSPKIITPIFR
jgi:hypothetical protein